MALGVAADIDAAPVAAAERAPRRERYGGRFVGERAGRELQFVEGLHLVLVRIGRGIAAGQEADLADADDARIGAAAEEADGEFAAGQEGFDQRRLAIGLEHLEALGRELAAIGDPAGLLHAFAGALGERLDEQRVRELYRLQVAG